MTASLRSISRVACQAFRVTGVLIGLLALPSASAADGPGRVTATRLDGRTVTGPLVSFAGGQVRVGSTDEQEGPQEVSIDELLSLDLTERPRPVSAAAVLEFANGDRLAAEVGAVEEDSLAAKFGGEPVAVPVETLCGIAFKSLDPDDGSAALPLRDSGADDVVLLMNGDRMSGQFAALSATELKLDAAGRDARVPRDRIAAVAFSPELTAPATIDGPRQIVQSSDGWLTVRDLVRRDDGSWHATAAFGEPVTWPAGGVDRILFAGGRAEFLSEAEPAGSEFVPYLDGVWPVRPDRAVTGEPLSAGGVTYPKGVGVHSRSRLTYRLDGGYASFQAVVGLAASAGEMGSAEFAVEVDGREVFRSGPVTAADAKPVDIDLSGAEALVLTVDFGRNGDARDRANWCDAVLVRK